ncbi:unnamed protein product [Candidula unifasciata]|uniref:Schlafen AlbA-2 domain-containing protein n=1 Tax=Candidula unifasciata TaxID=100452 RepID=A0A8S3YQG4_9EUPU|nr:unnamed protein product [Candidula unifasciata]
MNESTPANKKYGVFLGPIVKGGDADQIATNVFKMLLTLGVRCSEISCVLINSKAGYVKIEVGRSECEDYLMKVLPEIKSIMSLFDLRLILECPKHVKVVRIRQVAHANSDQDISDGGSSTYRPGTGETLPELLRNTQPIAKESHQRPKAAGHEITVKTPVNITDKSSETSSSALIEFQELVEEDDSRLMRQEVTSVSDMVSSDKGHESEILHSSSSSSGGKPVMLNKKTSTPAGLPCDCPDTVFYRRFQQVGTETRYSEFKRGGVIYNQQAFRTLIAKYVCGFANAEGGTLFFGVSDDGIVRGVAIDKVLEKTIRLDIDFAVGLIKPLVEKCEYTVNFARVEEEEGEFSRNLKVLEVCVKPRKPGALRYSYNGVGYIKRDGSLQKIKIT